MKSARSKDICNKKKHASKDNEWDRERERPIYKSEMNLKSLIDSSSSNIIKMVDYDV